MLKIFRGYVCYPSWSTSRSEYRRESDGVSNVTRSHGPGAGAAEDGCTTPDRLDTSTVKRATRSSFYHCTALPSFYTTYSENQISLLFIFWSIVNLC